MAMGMCPCPHAPKVGVVGGCLAPAPQDEYCIEHMGGPGRASLFVFPQGLLLSPVFCHTSPPTFLRSAIAWSHMM